MGQHDDEDESTVDQPPPRPTSMGVTTRPIPRSQAPDFDDGDFEGDDPPTTAEPVRDDHHLHVPRSPSIPTRPVPKFRSAVTDDAFDDDANPTMFDPHVPTGGEPRPAFDPHARIDDNRRTTDLSGAAKRARDATADQGPAARRALAGDSAAPDPRARDVIATAPIRKTPAVDPLSTAPMGSGALGGLGSPPSALSSGAAGSSPPARGPRVPPGPTGPMLRPPPDAPPSLGAGRASGPQKAIAPAPPPAFVTDRKAAMTGSAPELPHTIPDPPSDGAPAPAPLRSFGPPPSQPIPPPAQRPAQAFDPHARIDDSSRTHRWEGKPVGPPAAAPPAPTDPFATPYAPTDQSYPPSMPAPMQAISHKTPDSAPRPAPQHRPVPQVQIRPISDLSKTPARGMGRLAPPHDPNRARTRKTQDVMIWGSVVVIIGSIVTLVIWLIAR